MGDVVNIHLKRGPRDYRAFLPAALAFAHLRRAAAAIFTLPAALIPRFGGLGEALRSVLAPLRAFAQRAFCPAEILARPTALICRRPGARSTETGLGICRPPRSCVSSSLRPSIRSWIPAALWRSRDEILSIVFDMKDLL